MAEVPNVALKLAGRPENVLIVRQALVGVAESVGLDHIETNDLVTAVTEAANNVVVHAYGGEEGPLEVQVCGRAECLLVLVRDHGRGVKAFDPPGEEISTGIGLTVIGALADSLEFAETPGGGAELRMEFDTDKAQTLELLTDGAGELHTRTQAVEMRLAPSSLARAVVPRVLSAVAARAHFTTDTISEVQLVADLLLVHAGGSIAGTHIGVGVDFAPRTLELQIGPLPIGRASALIDQSAAAGIGAVIERLTDERRVALEGSHERLALRIVERR